MTLAKEESRLTLNNMPTAIEDKEIARFKGLEVGGEEIETAEEIISKEEELSATSEKIDENN